MKKYKTFQDLQIGDTVISIEFQHNYHIIYDFWKVDSVTDEMFGKTYHLKGLETTSHLFIPKPNLTSPSFSYRPIIWFADINYGLKTARDRLNVVQQDFNELYNDIQRQAHQENVEFQKILHEAKQCIKNPKENED